jgi:hypothetical protein
VRKCLWSMQHVMRDDPCRRATFGMTIENSTTRLWFCCRSSVIVSEAFDFIAVRVFSFPPRSEKVRFAHFATLNQIRTLKHSSNSLLRSPSPIGSRSASIPPLNAFRKRRKVSSLLFIPRMTKQTQGGIALQM